MAFATFQEIIDHVGKSARRSRIAVAGAADPHTLEAVMKARQQGLVTPVLVGDEAGILRIFGNLGIALSNDIVIVNEPEHSAACGRAVAMIRAGEADLLMKGAADTHTYLRAVVNREQGLGCGRLMSHFALLEIPGYHKVCAVVDSGMVAYPTLEQKKAIIENTAEVFFRLGYSEVKVAALACAEKVNPKMPETVEAAQLAEMSEKGEIPGCIVAGPVSYDCAMSAEIARVKGYDSPVAGDPDVLLGGNIHTGNVLGKCLTVSCGAKMAGFIVGTACPVVMTSRGASTEEKFNAIVLAAAVA